MTELEKMKYLTERVDYNPETGLMTWKPREGDDHGTKIFNSKFAGRECGVLHNGYTRIRVEIDRKAVYSMVHRVAWFIGYGVVPTGDIDHINGVRSDNRLINLRDVSKSVNSRNMKRMNTNTSGVAGVYWNGKKWVTQVIVEGKRYHLGHFSDFEEAKRITLEFRQVHGFTDRHGM